MAKFSMLVPVRPNSKFLAHFLFGFFTKTDDLENTELLLMPALEDRWNRDLFDYFGEKLNVFYEPEPGRGQAGHHEFLNELAKQATGDWLLSFCDDFHIIYKGWDTYLRNFIQEKGLDSQKIYRVVPRFENRGAVMIMISRGWYETVGRMAGYPNGDSWINAVTDAMGSELVPQRCFTPQEFLFEDYSSDTEFASLMSSGYPNNTPEIRRHNLRVPVWESPELKQMIGEEAAKLRRAILEGGK